MYQHCPFPDTPFHQNPHPLPPHPTRGLPFITGSGHVWDHCLLKAAKIIHPQQKSAQRTAIPAIEENWRCTMCAKVCKGVQKLHKSSLLPE